MDPSVIELPIYKALAKLYDNYNNVGLNNLCVLIKIAQKLDHAMVICAGSELGRRPHRGGADGGDGLHWGGSSLQDFFLEGNSTRVTFALSKLGTDAKIFPLLH